MIVIAQAFRTVAVHHLLYHLTGIFVHGIAHRGMFAVPKFLREAVEAETRVITQEEPLFVV